MRILIYDINYAPELTGVGKYTGEMGAWLAAQGHTVRVITAMPYYPEWDVHASYKGKFWFTETIDGAVVHRCPFYVPTKVTSLSRIVHEFSFVMSSLPYWLRVLCGQPYDVVLCVGPPFHVGVLPVLYSKLKNVPLWLHLQDLQIDMAKELGMLTNKRFLTLLYSVESFILKHSTVVSTISEGMREKLAAKNVLRSPSVLFPNWVDDQYIRPLSRKQSLRAELGLNDDERVVLYSGSLGEKQGLDLIIEAARYFLKQRDVTFLICGSGGGKGRLQALVREYKLTNVRFLPLQPYTKLSALLATADIHLVLQKKSASDLVLPSKLTGILAAGGCALVSAIPGTTLYQVIDSYKMGILIEPESANALIDGLNRAFLADLSTYQLNARAYAKRYLNRTTILQTFEASLMRLQDMVKEPVAETTPD